MVISKQRKEKQRDFSLQSELDKITINSELKLTKQLVDLCEQHLSKINNTYPLLTDEFSEALLQTITLAFKGIVIDNSTIVSPLAWFANKYDDQDILKICNELTTNIFTIQISEKNNLKKIETGEKIEF